MSTYTDPASATAIADAELAAWPLPAARASAADWHTPSRPARRAVRPPLPLPAAFPGRELRG